MDEIAIRIDDADDQERVVREVGQAFYTHLRGLNRVADVRYEAVERAIALYEKAQAAGEAEPQVGGYGLLVFQRTALVCEDLLAVLWALGKANPWRGLTEYYAPAPRRHSDRRTGAGAGTERRGSRAGAGHAGGT
jgi:hypothetical protein